MSTPAPQVTPQSFGPSGSRDRRPGGDHRQRGTVGRRTRGGRRFPGEPAATAAVIAVGSAGGPLSAAHDTATVVLLASMHLATGAAFVATAAMVTAR
jgi:hypothetical protein